MGDLRYADAGGDIDEGDRAVRLIKQAVTATHGPEVLGGIGAFSGLFAFDPLRWKQPVLAASTDSVGTKVKVAIAAGRYRGIGIDLVNHCVNDILCSGAEPLFFLDYYATGRLSPERLAEVVGGAAAACGEAGCALVGGETAELPGLYALGDFDIAGFIVGCVERGGIIDGHRIEVGDAVLGLPSSGLHTNGYSLVRHILAEREIAWDAVLPGTMAPIADLLLEPHRSYLPAIRELRSRVEIRGLAHITGGGLLGNLPRILPAGMAARIERDAWEVPALFTALEAVGEVRAEEMWRTFNMGVGMVVVVPAAAASAAGVSAAGLPVIPLGEIVDARDGHQVVLR
jgi:phosphoribosylformylglycinamidine cyclo-ligase